MAESSGRPRRSPVLPIWAPRTPSEAGEELEDSATETEDAKSKSQKMRNILDRLRSWHEWEMRRQHSLSRHLLSKIFSYPKRPPCPDLGELIELATSFFPSRASLKVTICDFGEGRFKRSEATISQGQPFFKSKPEWATVRWIHVPVGLGLVHDSITHAFDDLGPKAPPILYQHSGPDLACEVVTLQDPEYLQDQLDVFNILNHFEQLTKDLDGQNIRHSDDFDMGDDIAYTAKHFGIGTNFWHLAVTDIPWQLGEGTRTSLLDTDLGTNEVSQKIDEQLLSRHPRYENAVLVRALFECYHRADGFVLTISPTAGISFLDRTTLRGIQTRSSEGVGVEKMSFIEHFMDTYARSGTQSWSVKTPKWFIVDMLTQLLVTPCALPSGRTVPEIQSAYLPLVRELKIRIRAPFKRHESVYLVREYVACMDEISQIYAISERKLDFLGRLKKDCEILEEPVAVPEELDEQFDSRLPKPSADSNTRDEMIRKIEWAMGYIRANHEGLPRILDELRKSLDDLFQLRTIEQNELAIIAESNNKAILVFTVVTIIFLPLSFFTSYFGMNFQGDYNLLSGQGYFWGVCGSITLIIVVFTLVYGFKDRLYGWIWGNRHSSLGSEYRYRSI